MKFKKEYIFGGYKKDSDDDFIIRYHAENGKTIEVVYYSITNNSARCYSVDGKQYYYLKDAKKACEEKKLIMKSRLNSSKKTMNYSVE